MAGETDQSGTRRENYAVGEVIYMHWDYLNPPRVGDVFDLDNGQRVEVLTAECSAGTHEARKLTVRVLGNLAQRRDNRTNHRRSAPGGMRWATGDGSPIGDCNGYHLARGRKLGTLCGRYGPSTPPDPSWSQVICGSCARIANVARQSPGQSANAPASAPLGETRNTTDDPR
jgi:hypothetical protein